MTAATDHLRCLVQEHAAGGTVLRPLSEELVATLDLPADLGDAMAIATVVDLTGVSAHTLRYYERAGMVSVARDAAGRRAYDREALGRIVFVTRLRMSDMPIRDIRSYIELVDRGPATVPERLEILHAHRASVQAQMADLQWALAVIDYKITTYGGHCAP